MSRVCDLTGKKAMVGHHVSFSNRKTLRRFNPNLHTKKYFIPEEDRWVVLKLSTSAMRTINKKGIYACLLQWEKTGRI
jgi:large subunit ribosomal protein L28